MFIGRKNIPYVNMSRKVLAAEKSPSARNSRAASVVEGKNGVGGREGPGQPGGQRATSTLEPVLLFPRTHRPLPLATCFPSIYTVRDAHTVPRMLERTRLTDGSTDARKERKYARGCRMQRKGRTWHL